MMLFLQFALILPLLTAAGLLKLGWSGGVPENWPSSNTTITRCQFDLAGGTLESNTAYDWEAIQVFVDWILNYLGN